jgi:hypothetical protein
MKLRLGQTTGAHGEKEIVGEDGAKAAQENCRRRSTVWN